MSRARARGERASPPLDGGRGFRALSRPQRWFGAGALAVAWAWFSEGLLVLLLLLAALRAFGGDAPPNGDRPALTQFAALVLALSALTMIRVPS